jgi:hypothetical protein
MSSDLSSRRTIKPTKQINTKKSPSLPQETVEYLKAWMMSPEHIAHPYPTEQEKAEIMAETGIELKQLTNWFVNNRKRFWKPRVEAKLSVEEGSGRLIPAAQAHVSFQGQENEGHNHVAPQFVEDPHTVSEGGSVVSSSSGRSGWSDDEDDSNRSSVLPQPAISMYRNGFVPQLSKEGSIRREVVDVHVLYPEVNEGDVNTSTEVLPTLRDVTIKGNVKKEMVLATFPKCLLQYSVPEEIENDRKKVQTRRDGEVLRVKKHYLKLYLATRGIHSVSSPCGEDPIDVIAHSYTDSSNNSVSTAFSQASNDTSSASALRALSHTSFPHKRKVTCDAIEETAPRRRRISSMNGDEEWRSICQNASDIFCDTLPGLEEAAVMFGYITQ